MKRSIHLILLSAVLTLMAACTNVNRNEEADRLKSELQEMLFKTPKKALARVDSAEQAGLFSATTANLIRTNIYGNMGQTRLAIYYGEHV